MIGVFGKLLVKVILLPFLFVLLVCYGIARLMVNVYSMFKWFIGILCGIVLIGTFIWYRQDYMRYVLVAIVEGVLVTFLATGVFVEVMLETAVKAVSGMIMGGF